MRINIGCWQEGPKLLYQATQQLRCCGSRFQRLCSRGLGVSTLNRRRTVRSSSYSVLSFEGEKGFETIADHQLELYENMAKIEVVTCVSSTQAHDDSSDLGKRLARH